MNTIVPHPIGVQENEPPPDRSRLHFQVSHRQGRVRVEPAIHLDSIAPRRGGKSTLLRIRNPAKLLPAGKGFVQIFGRAPGPYTIAWRDADKGSRRRAMRTTWSKASDFAGRKATELANRETGVQQMTPVDAASFLRAQELLHATGLSIELAGALLARWFNKFTASGVRGSFETFMDAALDRHIAEQSRDFRPLPLPDLVKVFLEEKSGDICPEYHLALSQQLRRLAKWSNASLHFLTAEDLGTFLRDLKVGARTRANYCAALEQLAGWAKDHHHLPPTWSELERVKRAKVPSAEIKIFTPEELTKLLSARAYIEDYGQARSGLVQLLALQAFAGLRHSEAKRLDWRDVHLTEREIFVAKNVARKIERDRIVPISDNLAAWLQLGARPNGPICGLAQTSGALTKAKKASGLPSGRNESRNILRKSFISYRLALTRNRAQVAEEAGNSPSVIKANYLRPIPEAEAKRWFGIWPTTAGITQLNFAGI